MKKIIKRIVDRIRFSYPIMIEESLTKILEEELPDFSRIDEERFKRIYASKVCDIGLHIQEYNSTLPPALVPLPKEMPKDLTRFAMGHDVDEVWDKIISEYGTPANNLQPLPGVMPALWHDAFTDLLHKRMQPSEFYSLIRNTYGTPAPKPELPSVEELAKEVYDRFRSVPSGDDYTVFIAQHLHDKYSLHPREWWKDAIPYSTQFKYNDTVYTFSEYSYESSTQKTWIHNTGGGKILCSHCTPYTPPSAQDIIAKHNLSEEEVKILREGKCT